MKRLLSSAALCALFIFPYHLVAQSPGASRSPKAEQITRLIKYAGSTKRAAAGTVAVNFAIYSDATGGTPLWQETQNVQLDAQGRYTALLGSSRELPMEIFSANSARWLGVQVLADSEPEQARVLLVSVPYALKAQDAETLGGRPASDYLLAAAAAGGSSSPKVSGRGGQAAGVNPEGPVQTTTSTTLNAIPKFSGTDTLADSLMFEQYNQSATDAFGNALANEDVVRIGDGTGLAKRLEVGRIVTSGFDVVTTLPNSVHVVNNYLHGIGFQGNSNGIGFSTGFAGTSRGLNGAGVRAFALPPLSLQAQVPGDYTYAILAGNYHPQGAAVEAFSAYDGTAFGADFPVQTETIGLYAAASHTNGIPAVVDQLAAGGGKILSARSQGVEKIAMTTAGNITATGSVTAASFSGSGAGLTGVTASSATTATSLANNPADCASGQYANAISASGNLSCSSIQATELPSLSGSYVDVTSVQTIGGAKTFLASAFFSNDLRAENITLPASSYDGTYIHGMLIMGNQVMLHSKGSNNIHVGESSGGTSLTYAGPSPGSSNVAMGTATMQFNTTGYANTAVGHWAFRSNSSGWGNTALGSFASTWAVSGDKNTALGWGALAGGNTSTTGSYNTAVGANANAAITTGIKNTALGTGAGYFIGSGNNNTSIGFESGMTGSAVIPNDPTAANSTGSNNTYLGYRSGPSADAFNNSTAIGANAVVSASNAMVLGDNAVSVGIGTSSPAFKLDVAGIIRSSTGGFRFPDGTTQLTASTGNLGADPAACSANNFVTDIGSNGALTCTQPSSANLSDGSTLATKTYADTGVSTEAAARAVVDEKLAVRGINYIAGCDSCNLLQTTDSEKAIYMNVVGPMTINQVTCISDAGAPTINIKRDDGSPVNILSSDLACSTGNGTTIGVIAVPALALNNKLDFYVTGGTGVAHRVTIVIKATVN